MDKSTKVGGRRKKAGTTSGPNNTAGNSSGGSYGRRRDFGTSRITGVAKEAKRFAKTQTRTGRNNAFS